MILPFAASPARSRIMWTVFAGITLCGPDLAAAQDASQPVAVTITDKGCEPNTLSVPAGKTTFKIKNASRRAVEWEILDGVMVVEERENIIPGFVQSLTATLKAGQYQMTCGLLSNPKGVLNVTAAATGTQAGEPGAPDLGAALADYKVYVAKEVGDLVEQTKRFTEAVKAGKLQEARDL
jgi:iron uptake system component EfeO